MAENEYLNAARSGRWKPVVDGIVRDRDPDDVALSAIRCLIKEIGAMYDRLNLGTLIASAEDTPILEVMCGQSEEGQIPKEFLIEASRRGSGLAAIIERFLTAAYRNCTSDIPHEVAKRAMISISGSKATLAAIESIVLPAIRTLAIRMAVNPGKKPRCDPRLLGDRRRTSRPRSTEVILTESLLKRS